MKTTTAATTLTPEQIHELRAALLSKRDELQRKRLRPDDTTFEKQAEPMDAATDATAQSELLGLSDHDDRLRVEVEHALAKFDRGEYGTSEDSGEPIAFARLRILPWARLTVEEEEARERAAR